MPHCGRDLGHASFARGHAAWGMGRGVFHKWYFGLDASGPAYNKACSFDDVPATVDLVLNATFGTPLLWFSDTRAWGQKGYGANTFAVAATPYNGYATLAAVPFTLVTQPIASGANLVAISNETTRFAPRYSADNGATWTLGTVTMPPTYSYYNVTGMVIRLMSGRLIAGGYGSRIAVNCAVCFHSDDNGATWTGVEVDVDATGSTSALTWQNGSSLYFVRGIVHGYAGLRYASADEGATWGTYSVTGHVDAGIVVPLRSGRVALAPYDQSYATVYSDDNLATVVAFPANHKEAALVDIGAITRVYTRVSGTPTAKLRYSDDECATWSDLISISAGVGQPILALTSLQRFWAVA